MKDKEQVILIGAMVTAEIYDKAVKILMQHGHNMVDTIKAFIESIANGDIVITGNHFESKGATK